MAIKRGEIWWASLAIPRGSEPGFRRPVVIISANTFNDSRIKTVLVAVITSNLRLADAPGNIKITKKISHLSSDSVINISQLMTIDKQFLTEKVAALNTSFVKALDESLKLVLSL